MTQTLAVSTNLQFWKLKLKGLKSVSWILTKFPSLIIFFQAAFDPFNIRYANNWNAVMDWFRKQVVNIDNEAKHFIDDSFKTLRSAEGAFDMLLKFKHIRSRETINNQMMRKFNDILLQFGKEVK